MTISLETLQSFSVQDLVKLKEDLQQIEKSKQQDVVKKFIKDMDSIGVSYDALKDKTVGELLNSTKEKKLIPAKYMNPVDKKTWTGRGPEPKWFKELIASGKSREDLEIK